MVTAVFVTFMFDTLFLLPLSHLLLWGDNRHYYQIRFRLNELGELESLAPTQLSWSVSSAPDCLAREKLGDRLYHRVVVPEEDDGYHKVKEESCRVCLGVWVCPMGYLWVLSDPCPGPQDLNSSVAFWGHRKSVETRNDTGYFFKNLSWD